MSADLLSIEIRRVDASDAPVILDLIHVCFAELSTLVPPSGAAHETEASIGALIDRGAVFLATSRGTPIGCVAAELKGDRLYVGRLAVLPAWRRRGVAQGLMAAVETYAGASGQALLELNVRLVLSGNIRLFEGLGYRISAQGSHPGFDIPTYHVMQKHLGLAD